MKINRVVEYGFFFGMLLLAGYLVWLIMAPFVTSLALAAVIVTICYPLYEKILRFTPRQNKTAASLITTLFAMVAIVLPLFTISSLVLKEMVGFYHDLESGSLSIESSFSALQEYFHAIAPSLNIDLTEQAKGTVSWLTGSLGAIFAGTISTIFVFLIAMVGTFYFFRDGKDFVNLLIKASPLLDGNDRIIFKRLARSVRAVATGTILTSMIQGTLVALGFALFGVPRAILWGSLASVSALMPGFGTTIVTVPGIIYLFVSGDVMNGTGLLLWSILIVGTVDNLIAPYLISRGNNLHPFIVLISVLGGVVLLGPIGFVIGPVVVTFFMSLLEMYNQYVVKEGKISSSETYD